MVNVIIEEPAFTIRITGGIGAQGSKGDPGNGIASAVLNDDYTLTLNFTDGTSYTTEPIRGAQGETGNGIASAVLNPDYTLTLYFTDGTHYTTASIRGAQGEKGEKGDPGFSPIATVSKSGTVTTLTVTDEDGTTTAEILDGAPGAKGAQGIPGVSPTVTVTDITGGHRITITDAEHPGGISFDVMDGDGDLSLVDNDLSQWLYAENKYYDANLDLVDLQGFNTYKIPCMPTDYIIVSWSDTTSPYGTLSPTRIWAYESENGISRDLTSRNYSNGGTTRKKIWFVAPDDAEALYLTFEASRVSDVTVVKNTPRSYIKDLDVANNFIVPINSSTAVDGREYYNIEPTLQSWDNVNYHTWWIHVKAGDVLMLKSAVEGLPYNTQICTDEAVVRSSDLTITFETDALAIIFEKTTTTNNAVLIQQGAKLGISSENVFGLVDAVNGIISGVVSPIAEQVEDIDDRVVSIEQKLNAQDIVYSDGDTFGYYRVRNDSIEKASSTTFKCQVVEVTDAMTSVSFTIKSTSGISSNIIYCGFADENGGYISSVPVSAGVYDLEIPNNAKYIYLSFFGDTYNTAYTIRVNGVVTQEELSRLSVSNPYYGVSAVAFGTSLTYRAQTTGGYLQYLPGLSGMTVDNQGVGSSYILGDGGSQDMLVKIKSYSGYSDKTVCLLEGFVNDWYYSKTLGTYTDNTETTVCGCVRSALNYIMSQNANITLFLILDHYGRNYSNVDCSSSATNNAGITQYSYYEEIAKVAESLGIPVIKEYAGSQISENTPQYLLDNIHPNAKGAEQSANFIWSKLKQHYVNVI